MYGRGRSTPSGTGILSPDAQDAPARKDAHPTAWNVPVSVGGRPGDGEERGDGLRDVAEGRRLFAREVTGLGGEEERARRPGRGGEMTTLR